VVSSTSATSRGETEHVAQDQHCTLAPRQVLQCGDKRQLDALASFIPGRRGSQRIDGARVWVDPDWLPHPVRELVVGA
jgi:hypothetical protein